MHHRTASVIIILALVLTLQPAFPQTVSGQNTSNIPRFVILFIGDGMGFEHIKAAGYYKTGGSGAFPFESFPYQGEVTTHSASHERTDSAAGGTAIATGTKVNNGVISIALPGDEAELETILEKASQQGKATGLISTSYLTDATPAAFGAHELNRDNQDEIALDYLYQTRPNVLFGGGGCGLSPDLAQDAGYQVVRDRSEMQALTGSELYVSGQFDWGFMPFEFDGMEEYPHLSEMTATVLDLLDDDPEGFFLMVEGGIIDESSHANDRERMIHEVIEFGNAVQVALDWAEGRDDVLIIVTADHETGGLTVTENNGAGQYPTVTWSTEYHTSKNVPIYAYGKNANRVWGVMDNTEIRDVIEGTRPIFMPFKNFLPITISVTK